MEAVIYYAEADGISLERMVRKGNFSMRTKHFHNQYEIFYLIEGERQFFFNNRSYLVRGGSLILVDENVIHMTSDNAVPEFGHDRIILYVDKQKMRELDGIFPQTGLVDFFRSHYGVFHLNREQQTAFLDFYRRIMHELDRKMKNYKAAVDMELLLYFIGFMRDNLAAAPDDLSASDNPRHQNACRIAEYISAHYTEPITLDGLAGRFFISKYYLCRTFKEITGYSVNEYVNIHRIRQAKRLLEETDLSVRQISQQLGYESVSYFEKVFKSFMTMPPLKYRKTLNTVTGADTPASGRRSELPDGRRETLA